MLRAYLSCINDLDSTRYERIYYYVPRVWRTSISSMMFAMFDEQTRRTIMFVMFDEWARRTIYIFLVYRN